MGCQRPILGNLPRPLGLWFAVLVCLAFLSGALRVNAQDVAEAARQEKARQATQGKPKSKVYTNEDLKNARILTPEDRARAEAAKKEPVLSPTQPPAPSIDAGNESSEESLGEIARRYRREKEARRLEQAVKAQSPSPFKMELPKAALAAPVAPHIEPVVPTPMRPAPKKSAASPAPAIRDPFSRGALSGASRGAISAVGPTNLVPSGILPRANNSAPKNEAIVLPSARTTVTIQSGDSLWKLARQYLGHGSRWHELTAANPGLPDPSRIRPGSVVVIPRTAARVSAKLPANVVVQKGDSLWKIAKAQFGSGSQWLCLAQSNPQLLDFDRIRPGQTLTIPATCGLTP